MMPNSAQVHRKEFVTPASTERKGDVGSLLRMFQSEYFDAHLHMHYLFRMVASGVQDYLVNELYKLTDNDIDYYLPQLCHLALLRFETSELARFLLDKAATSMHFALKIHWLVQSAVDDQIPQLIESATQMWQESEMAMVNSSLGENDVIVKPKRKPEPHPAPKQLPRLKSSLSDSNLRRSMDSADGNSSEEKTFRAQGSKTSQRMSRHVSPPPSSRLSKTNAEINEANIQDRLSKRYSLSNLRKRHMTNLERASYLGMDLSAPNALNDLNDPISDRFQTPKGMDDTMFHFLLKQRRCDYFNLENMFISYLLKIGNWLVTPKRHERESKLRSTLELLNEWLFERRFHISSTEAPFALSGVHVPLLFGQNTKIQLIRIHSEECKVFSSKKRAPFLFLTESADLDEDLEETETVDGQQCGAQPSIESDRHSAHSAPLPSSHKSDDGSALEDGSPKNALEKEKSTPRRETFDPPARPLSMDAPSQSSSSAPPRKPKVKTKWPTSVRDCVLEEVRLRMSAVTDIQPEGKMNHLLAQLSPEDWYKIVSMPPPVYSVRHPKKPLCENCRETHSKNQDFSPENDDDGDSVYSDEDSWIENFNQEEPDENDCMICYRAQEAVISRFKLWPELWEQKVERLRRSSPYGHLKSLKFAGYIVKAGDDVRQELLASQLIRQFQIIFEQAPLDLWLRPIEVLVTSSDSGLIEFVENSYSIDGLKKKFIDEKGQPMPLALIFKKCFGDNLFQAKKNFIESFAAYSLVCYFLQVKDRHNGNLLIDSVGHVIHIDFGFMLSNAPGSIAFETAPFKLTAEFLELMDGEGSDQFLELWRRNNLNGPKRRAESRKEKWGYEYFRTILTKGFLALRKHSERIILLVRMMIEASKFPCMAGGRDYVLKGLEDRFFLKLTEAACTDKVAELIDISAHNWRSAQYDNYQRYFVGIQ